MAICAQHDPVADGNHLRQAADRAYGTSGVTELPLPSNPDTDQRDAMERRRLLQWAATGLGLGAAGLAEPTRQLLDLVLTAEHRSIEDWHITCADHLNGLANQPPADVRHDLVIDLLALRRQLERAPAVDLLRVTAMLAALHANALTRLGEHGAAIRWWRTARDAADTSADRDLRLLVRVEEAAFGLYGQRDTHTTLVLTEQAQRIAGPRPLPSVGLAKIASTRAKALSVLGRHTEARGALNCLIDLSGTDLRTPWPGFWTTGQVHFTESWVHAAGGDETATDRAAGNVTRATTDYQYGANIKLHRAMCTIVSGGIDQGARQAATVLHDLPAAYRSSMITETGKMVLRAVPMDSHRRPAVSDLREVLITAAQPA